VWTVARSPASRPISIPMDSLNGPKPIELIEAGDVVVNSHDTDMVLGVGYKYADSLCRVKTKDGREVVCTPNHEFFTQKGWVAACNLSRVHYILSTYETYYLNHYPNVSILPKGVQQSQTTATLLLADLLAKRDAPQSRSAEEEIGVQSQVVEKERGCEGSHVQANEEVQPDAQCSHPPQTVSHIKGDGMEACGSWRQRNWTHPCGIGPAEFVSSPHMESCCEDGTTDRQWLPNLLQAGCCYPRVDAGDRSGRQHPPQPIHESQGSEEGFIPRGSWVESSEILQREDLEPFRSGEGRIVVYNLHVEKEHNYSVNGLCVSNCQFMLGAYIDVISNIKSGDFKGVFLPSKEQILLGTGKDTLSNSTGSQTSKNSVFDIDLELYSLTKFMKMIADGDTAALELLHTPDDMILEKTEEWEEIVSLREFLINKSVLFGCFIEIILICS